MRIGIALVWILVLSGTVNAQQVTVTTSSPPEAQLAAIDKDRRILPEATIREYGKLLDRLEMRCEQPRMRIAEMIVGARGSLKKNYARQMTLVELLGLAATMMEESGLKNQDCAQTFSLLVLGLGSRR